MKQTITLFMWGYQPSFRIGLENFAKRVLEEAGLTTEVEALLVGVQEPGGSGHPVCVEPERGPWPVQLFADVDDRIAALSAADPRQNIIYGDEPSNRDNPSWIRASAVRGAVKQCLAPSDKKRGVRSFLGAAAIVDGYRVVPVVQVALCDLDRLPHLQRSTHGRYATPTSFIESVLEEIMREATRHLTVGEPGRRLETFDRDPIDVVRSAGRSLMATPEFVSDRMAVGSLFEGCNKISALRYEGSAGRGRMVVARVGHPAVHVILEFERPVPLRAPTWARKVLQMGSDEVALLCDGRAVYGLGRLCDAYDPDGEDAFQIDFVGHYTWEVSHAGAVLMRAEYAIPKLPSVRIREDEIRILLRRVFGDGATIDAARIWSLVRGAIEQKHGTLLVVSDCAAEEAERLSAQATPVKPTELTDALVRRVTGIDGAVLVDLAGRCHAIGVILDGEAVADGDPSRGARFNSAMRYVATANAKTVALIVSEDGHVNVLPMLRPQLRRSDVERHVAALHAVADDPMSDYHKERNWLDEHRFYLSAAQCVQVEDDLKKLEAKVKSEVGAIWLVLQPFQVDPEMNDSYFQAEV